MILSGGVYVAPEVAALLGPNLKRWATSWESVNGMPMRPDVRRVIEELDVAGRLHRQRAEHERNTRNAAPQTPVHDPEVMTDSLFLSTSAAARWLGISERAVRGRLERGSLHGTRTPRGWRIDPADLALAMEAA